MSNLTVRPWCKTAGARAVRRGGAAVPVQAFAAWEPTKTVEFVVPAGTGGGADQMARIIRASSPKNKLMRSRWLLVQQGGRAGAEGFLDVKEAKGDPHKLIITPVEPVHDPACDQYGPFNWRD